jgi:predicted phage terminase large subunit-like protein
MKKTLDPIEQQLQAARRLLAIKTAKDDLLAYLRLRMPDPNAPGDVTKSRYQVTPLARILTEVVHKIDAGKLTRVAISVGPQFGKSDILSRAAPAWLSGRDPYRNIMLGSYNQDFANEFGGNVRDMIEMQFHRQIFPGHALKVKSVDHLETTVGGQLNFVGVGGSGTGKPADIFMIDDPIRNDDDAQSETYRERLWKWFNGVVFSRGHDKTAVIIIHTRWHQDDLIGRLCDPDHPERNGKYAGIAKNWTYINLPAVVKDEKLAHALGLPLAAQDNADVIEQFGTAPMTSLWPGRKSLPLLAEAKRQDPRIFGALYMGEPTPEDGEFFKADMLETYDVGELPSNLRMYGASDHAVSTKQMADKTVIGCVGVDDKDNVWVMPDVIWGRFQTDKTVENLLAQMQRHRPFTWWMENEMISKSFGPFLRKRMMEEQVYTFITPVTPAKDKQTRARAIQGRMSMRKVKFPRYAPWWLDARSELLKFPFGTHDDFVDWLSHVGQGLNKMISAPVAANDERIPNSTTLIGMLNKTRNEAANGKRSVANAGW